MKLRLTLIQKLIASFAIIGICLVTALVYAIHGLGTMHRMVDDIARHDLSAATSTIVLRDSILAQQRAAGRFLIFKLPQFRELFINQANLFKRTLALLQQQPVGPELEKLRSSYLTYTELSERIFAGKIVRDVEFKHSAEQVEKAIESLRTEQRKILDRKLETARKREARTASLAFGLALGGVSVALLVAAALIYSFSTSIRKLQKTTHRIAAGDFDYDPHIPPGDEIGSLAQDFMSMAVRLKELEQISLDASPLTRLPGNIAIERSINRRLREGTPFAMCYLDLDNFKSYNDRYGYIKASDILHQTGRLIHDAVHRLNDPDTFVGHIGGDDFVVIIDARLARQACQAIIKDFDEMIPSYYSEEDRIAGSIQGADRYGVVRVFPLLSISIAVLNCQPGSYSTAAEIATAAAKVKDRLKKTSGSNYIIVREAHSGEI
ncbi:GGDEF domain-containing protein [Pelotalea chapellei]|uniref:diguanylate cyclase n=1 Tax=Pelotalea chapellei TaxID=44671 RepID=A0ABS5U713_9BACT|nr:diguanylate cyclase [Pelotalea chapellei]MBT1071454.1 diguanylate cyclase [Pelotalea chapellei]